MNSTGLAMATSSGSYNYPVGTVLIKEQFDDTETWHAQEPTDYHVETAR